MKNFKFTILFLLIAQVVMSQRDAYIKHVVSVVTPKKDTLYLYNDQVGQCIADFWNNPTTKGEKPVIVLTNNTISIRKRLYKK